MRTTIEYWIDYFKYNDANEMVKENLHEDWKQSYEKAYTEWIKGNERPMNNMVYSLLWEWGYVY